MLYLWRKNLDVDGDTTGIRQDFFNQFDKWNGDIFVFQHEYSYDILMVASNEDNHWIIVTPLTSDQFAEYTELTHDAKGEKK